MTFFNSLPKNAIIFKYEEFMRAAQILFILFMCILSAQPSMGADLFGSIFSAESITQSINDAELHVDFMPIPNSLLFMGVGALVFARYKPESTLRKMAAVAVLVGAFQFIREGGVDVLCNTTPYEVILAISSFLCSGQRIMLEVLFNAHDFFARQSALGLACLGGGLTCMVGINFVKTPSTALGIDELFDVLAKGYLFMGAAVGVPLGVLICSRKA